MIQGMWFIQQTELLTMTMKFKDFEIKVQAEDGL